MGERAYIVLKKPKKTEVVPAIYVHWLGQEDSMKRVVNYLTANEVVPNLARVCGALCNYIGWEPHLSGIQIVTIRHRDMVDIDHGTYVLEQDYFGRYRIKEHIEAEAESTSTGVA